MSADSPSVDPVLPEVLILIGGGFGRFQVQRVCQATDSPQICIAQLEGDRGTILSKTPDFYGWEVELQRKARAGNVPYEALSTLWR